MDNDKKIKQRIRGIEESTLEGVMRLGNNKDIEHLYETIRVMKFAILRDEFSFSENDPTKNAINKAFYKGGDYFLTTLVHTIKKSPQLLDQIEEEKEKNGNR